MLGGGLFVLEAFNSNVFIFILGKEIKSFRNVKES